MQEYAGVRADTEPIEDGYLWAECGACGFNYTHASSVRVETASGEGVRVETRGEDETSKIDKMEFASRGFTSDGRRQTIVIEMWCESCHATTELLFHQHKGQTQISSRASDPNYDESDHVWSRYREEFGTSHHA